MFAYSAMCAEALLNVVTSAKVMLKILFNCAVNTVEHSYNKPEIPDQTVCYKQ